MSTENLIPATEARRRWLVSLVLTITLVVVALIASQLAAGGQGPGQVAGDAVGVGSEARSSAESTADNVGRAAPEAEAEKALRGFLGASDEALQRADGTSRDVTPFATQAMIDEVRNESLNLEAQKIEQTGTVTVVKVDILDTSDSEVVLGACLSTAKVKTRDINGSDLRASQNPETRSMHHYVVSLVEGAWKVSAHSFPDNADC